MHNRIGHRFGRRLDVPNWLEPKTAAAALDPNAYSNKVLAIQNANLIAYWRLQEAAGAVADNYQGVAARDAVYDTVALGVPGIGDGLTAARFDGANSVVEIHTASLNAAWNGAEFTASVWFKVRNVGVWTDGTLRRMLAIRVDGTNWLYFTKSAGADTFDLQVTAGGVFKGISQNPFSLTTWVNAVVTNSEAADEFKGYINGAQVGATLNGLGVWAGALNAGLTVAFAFDVGGFGSFDGDGAHVALWDTILTDPEILSIATVP